MDGGAPPDPRLLQALALLHACLDDAPAPKPAPDDWLSSSTDVLTPWYPQAAPGWAAPAPPVPVSASDWDAYFGAAPGLAFEATAAPPPLRRAPADVLDADSADAVADALYGFAHALGRGDVDAALEHVSADYHVLEGDREVEREGLRQQLERLLDGRRAADLQVTLARIPEPLPHALGALARVTLQVDTRRPDGAPEGLVLHRVAVLRREDEGRFRLLALADVQP